MLQVTGSLLLSSGGENLGVTSIAPGGGIRGGAFTNAGTLALSGGGLASSSTTNASGGVISGGGGIGGTFSNGPGGIVQVAAGNTLTIVNPWTNAGLVTMQGGTLGSAAVTSTGVIQGAGIVGGAVTNQGTLRASGGELDLSGAATNAAGAQIQVQSGATMLFVQGLSRNDGTIALSGGTFDNANAALLNNGAVAGSGVIRTGGLTNQGSMNFADAATGIFGSVTTQQAGGGGNIQVTNNTTTFFGPVNLGAGTTFTATGATVRFLGGFVDNGTYVSDPSTSEFSDLIINGTGELIGGTGDVFEVSGNVVNQSQQSDTFDLTASVLDFFGANAHELFWNGTDDGASYGGYLHNFAVGTLELSSGGSLQLGDAGTTPRSSAALYVGTLELDAAAGDSSQQLAAFIFSHLVNLNAGDVLNIYYDPHLVANAYLNDQTWRLGGGGILAPVAAATAPEPRSTAVLLLLAIGFRRWRGDGGVYLPRPVRDSFIWPRGTGSELPRHHPGHCSSKLSNTR